MSLLRGCRVVVPVWLLGDSTNPGRQARGGKARPALRLPAAVGQQRYTRLTAARPWQGWREERAFRIPEFPELFSSRLTTVGRVGGFGSARAARNEISTGGNQGALGRRGNMIVDLAVSSL